MNGINQNSKKLLDKIYNLRGEDSVVLEKLGKEENLALDTKIKTEREKALLQENIAKLTADESLLQKEGEQLKSIIGSIKNDDFAVVLERLNIDFNPEEINHKLSTSLPDAVSEIANEKQLAEEKYQSVNRSMADAIAKIDELSIRKDEARHNQQKLNEIVNLALNGHLNMTRDDITVLLEKFGFDEEEKREAAKVLMFPEDALYEYDKGSYNSKRSMADVFSQARESIDSNSSYSFEIPKAPIKPIEIDFSNEDLLDDLVFVQDYNEPVVEETKSLTKEDIKKILTDKGFDILEFSSSDLEYLAKNYDENLLNENLKVIASYGFNQDIFASNAEMLFDKDLKVKIDTLISIGKEANDIYLNPYILVKYNLSELNNVINVLKESGLDPKQVPLMAF